MGEHPAETTRTVSPGLGSASDTRDLPGGGKGHEASSGLPGRVSGFSAQGRSCFLSVHTWFELTLNLGTRLGDFPKLTSSEKLPFLQ